MIITFTGTQSVGKSTLLTAMQNNEKYKNWSFEPEITRSLKAKYGLSINEEGDSFTQLFVINSHIENIVKHKDANVILDRCIVDGLAYTTYQYIMERIDADVYLYAKYIFGKIINRYDIIFHIPPEFPLVDDNVRSVDEVFRNSIANIINLALNGNSSLPKPRNVVTLTGTVEERLKQIDEAIERLELNNKL